MTKEKKLDDGWQLGFSIAGGFMFSLVTALLKSMSIINWSYWIICAPLILIGLFVFGMLCQLAYWDLTADRDSKKDTEDTDKLLMLMDLKNKDPQTLKRINENLNLFGKEYKKMSKEQLEKYIEEKKNEPKKNLVKSRRAKLKKLFG